MRKILPILLATAVLVLAGCAGPEEKFGRGFQNATEFARLGELRRSVEHTALWDNPNGGYVVGLTRGFARSFYRTGVGIYEIATFPLPPFEPRFTSETRVWPDNSIMTARYPYGGLVLDEQPVYPDSYEPGLISSGLFDTDTRLGFSSGDVAPIIPGSRFRVFDN